jgi:quinol monooxygenase YgiN
MTPTDTAAAHGGTRPTFVQLIEMETDDLEGFRRVEAEWHEATEGRNTVRRQVLTRDLHRPGHYVALVFFDSYESAMQNSEMPETKANAERLRGFVQGEPHFRDLEVVDDR